MMCRGGPKGSRQEHGMIEYLMKQNQKDGHKFRQKD